MNRRELIKSAVALVAAPAALLSAAPVLAKGGIVVPKPKFVKVTAIPHGPEVYFHKSGTIGKDRAEREANFALASRRMLSVEFTFKEEDYFAVVGDVITISDNISSNHYRIVSIKRVA